jgi:hypothetical protein
MNRRQFLKSSISAVAVLAVPMIANAHEVECEPYLLTKNEHLQMHQALHNGKLKNHFTLSRSK